MRVHQREVGVAVAGRLLEGTLAFPEGAAGLVIFAHGCGSGRFSPRGQALARVLQEARLATLLLDLLGVDEEEIRRVTRFLRPHTELVAARLVAALEWVGRTQEVDGLPVGLFGASTGAAAALLAATQAPSDIFAVVSRSGRPDLVADVLPDVRAPTLLVVGGGDTPVLDLNREALAQLRCPKELRTIPGATHLFEEPGALEQVGRLAAGWFTAHLRGAAGPEVPGGADVRGDSV